MRPPCGLAAALALATAACGGDSAKPLALIGGDCSVGHDAACASNKCLVLDSSTAYCTQACQAATDCPESYLCAAAPTGGSVCQQLGAGGVCGGDNDCPAGLKCDVPGSHCYIPVTRSACGPCTSDLQCGGGVCHAEATGEHFCAVHCAAGACAAGYACDAASQLCLPLSGSCRGGRALCAPCAGDIECGGPGDLCVRNLQSQETFCGTHCSAAADCAKNFDCVDLSGTGAGPNQCVPNSGTCAGYCDAPASDPAAVQRECGLGSTCDVTNRTCVAKTDGSLCAACASDDDCTANNANSRCVSNRTVGSPYLGERFCGTDCSKAGCSGAGCTMDPSLCQSPQFTCAAIGQNGTWPYQCVPARGSCVAGFGKLGDDCEKGGPDDCVSALCAQFGQEHQCSAACSADADCGDAHWRCCASSGADKYDCSHGPTGGAAGICAPAGGSFGDDCSPGTPPCQDGLCLDLGTAQVCTRGCTSDTDCISGFSCQSGTLKQSDGELGDSVKVCFPSGGGAVGSSCAFGPAACQSHLCLKKDSGNLCTSKCSVTADCPDKWDCAQEPMPDGTQLNVCIPPGTGP